MCEPGVAAHEDVTGNPGPVVHLSSQVAADAANGAKDGKMGPTQLPKGPHPGREGPWSARTQHLAHEET